MRQQQEIMSESKRHERETISAEGDLEASPDLADRVTAKYPSNGLDHQHPFSDPDEARRWADTYEKARYEGRHRFDPSYQWDVRTEKRLVRKVSPCCPPPPRLADHFPAAGSSYHALGMDHVLLARPSPQEYQSSNLR
jgi:hypothetical protein